MFRSKNKKIFFAIQTVSIFIAILYFAVPPQKALAVTQTTVDLYPVAIYDTTPNNGSTVTVSESRVAAVASSTDGAGVFNFSSWPKGGQYNTSKHIDFVFATNTIPSNAVIDSATITHNYYSMTTVPLTTSSSAKLSLPESDGSYNLNDTNRSFDLALPPGLGCALASNCPFEQSYQSGNFASLFTVSDLNAFKIRFSAYTNVDVDNYYIETNFLKLSVTYHIEPILSSVSISASSTTATTGDVINFTISGYDQEGGLINDATTTISLFSNTGTFATSSMMLPFGTGTTTGSSSASGAVAYFVSATNTLGGFMTASTTILFFDPVIVIEDTATSTATTTTETTSTSTTESATTTTENNSTSTTTTTLATSTQDTTTEVARHSGGRPGFAGSVSPSLVSNTPPSPEIVSVIEASPEEPAVAEASEENTAGDNQVAISDTPIPQTENPQQQNIPLQALVTNTEPSFFNSKTGLVVSGGVAVLGGSVYGIRMFRRRKNLLP